MMKLFKYPAFNEGRSRSLAKSVAWRLIGVLFLALITYIFTRHWITTTAITFAHHGAFILIYFAHDRFWNWTPWLRHSPAKPFARMILYETVLGNLVLGLISFAFTGDWQKATTITLTYILNKHWMYVVYDWLWAKLKWQTRSRETVVYAYVAADLLHVGHLRALQQAKALGTRLIVGVITDEGIAAYKRRPVISFKERMELVANLKCVDQVMRQESIDPTENLKRTGAEILVHGDDWPENYPGAAYMRSVGKKAVRTRYYRGQSTTRIIENILSRARALDDGQAERRQSPV